MNFKKYLALGTALTLTLLAGCGSSGSGDDQIVIYSNADEEAITAMENALDAGGYEGKYIVQTYGTSEVLQAMRASMSSRPLAPRNWGGSSWPKGPTWRRIWSP